MTPGLAPSSPSPAARATGQDATWAMETLWQAPTEPGASSMRGGTLPPDLAVRYGADLAIPLRDDRPTIVANFVSTLDGVVSFDPKGAGGGRAISGDFEPDRFLMGLLRATADAVLVGAGTVRASHGRSWTPGHVHSASAAGFARWRDALGLPPVPTAVLVTGTGVLASDGRWRPRGDQPLIVATTDEGAARLRADGLTGVDIVTLGDTGRVPVRSLVGLLASRGFRVVLSEAGPTVMGGLLAEGAVDELFLTIAPRVAGRAGDVIRPGLVTGMAFAPPLAPTGRLRSVRRASDHLFLRYALGAPDH